MSDDSNPNSDAPDGANMVPQAEFDAAVDAKVLERTERLGAQRREIGAKLDDALGQLEALKAGKAPEGAKPPAADKPPNQADEPPAWAAAMNTKLDGFGKQLDSYKARTRDDARTAFGNKVPQENRDDALLMLDGMTARGDLDLTAPGAVDAALAKLNPLMLRDPSRPAPLRAPQKGADDKLDWSAFKTWDDIPQDYRESVPDEVALRLSGRAGGSAGGGLFGRG